MALNRRPLWASAPDAPHVRESPNAPKETSTPRRVMALATIVFFLFRPNRNNARKGRRRPNGAAPPSRPKGYRPPPPPSFGRPPPPALRGRKSQPQPTPLSYPSLLRSENPKGPVPSAPTPQTPAQAPSRGLPGRAPPGSDRPPSGNRTRSPAGARWRQFLAVPSARASR